MKQRTLTIQELYKQGKSILELAGDIDASTDAWLLVEFVTGVSRAIYYSNLNREIDVDITKQYFDYIARRVKKEPLQHITGEQVFMGYAFQVNAHVLIPRQDTEVLVEAALGRITRKSHVLDMCTGSGCIIISLLKYAKERLYIEGVSGTGVDISHEALVVAQKNAVQLQVDVAFIQGDLFEGIEKTRGRYDLIVSNPPYIRTEDIGALQAEVRCHDPLIALDGKMDGLYFYREIIRDSVKFVADGGSLMLEIGYNQGESVTGLMIEAGYKDVQMQKDLTGLDRVVSGRYNRL